MESLYQRREDIGTKFLECIAIGQLSSGGTPIAGKAATIKACGEAGVSAHWVPGPIARERIEFP